MASHFFVDVHCHPSIKAYARSFEKNPGQQGAGVREHSSIWRTDAPSLFDKLKNYIASLTNFIQSDATNLIRGRVSVVCLSFYPQKKSFFVNKLGTGIVSDALTMLATEFGKERIDHLQSLQSYWEDLKIEMDFVRQQENVVKTIDGKKVTYQIARSYADIDIADRNEELGETKVLFVPTIEGCHVFDQVMDSYDSGDISAERLKTTTQRVTDLRSAKDGLLRPAFVTFAHHFGMACAARQGAWAG